MMAQRSFYMTGILLADVVDFAALPLPPDRQSEGQIVIAENLTNALREAIGILAAGSHRASAELVLGFVPTGDGFFILLPPDLAGYALFLAHSLRVSLLPKKSKGPSILRGIRFAVHYGEAAPFLDITGKQNFVGTGMNDCAYMLDGAKKRQRDNPPSGISIDESFIAISEAGLASFRTLYPDTPDFRSFLSAVKFSQSDQFEVVDKHDNPHSCRFVEFSRYALFNPPMPADLSARLQRIHDQALHT